jgi:hypothetical protein
MMRTSRGQVVLLIDPNGFENVTWEIRDNYGKPTGGTSSEIRNRKLEIESGKENIEGLYDGWIEHILKTENDELFAIIELSDGYYGSPEYYLEKIE